MKKTRKAVTFAVSFLLGTSIFAQVNVYAKEKPGKGQDREVKVERTSISPKNTVEKALPFGLEKKVNSSKSTLPPVIKQGGILLPVKAITKSLGAVLVWDNEKKTVTVTKGDITIVINLESKTASVNGGTEVALKSDSKTNNGTLVLLQFIAKNLGVDLDKTDVEQVVDETQPSDSTQPADSTTGTQENTSTTSTDVQAPASTDTQVSTGTETQTSTSTNEQVSTGTDVQAPAGTDVQTSTSTDTQTSTSTDVQVITDNTGAASTQS